MEQPSTPAQVAMLFRLGNETRVERRWHRWSSQQSLCKANQTFGGALPDANGNDFMWVSGGCSSFFLCNGKSTSCLSNLADTRRLCACGRPATGLPFVCDSLHPNRGKYGTKTVITSSGECMMMASRQRRHRFSCLGKHGCRPGPSLVSFRDGKHRARSVVRRQVVDTTRDANRIMLIAPQHSSGSWFTTQLCASFLEPLCFPDHLPCDDRTLNTPMWVEPPPPGRDTVVKATAPASAQLREWAQFNATYKILFVRDPTQNFKSIYKESWRDVCNHSSSVAPCTPTPFNLHSRPHRNAFSCWRTRY